MKCAFSSLGKFTGLRCPTHQLVDGDVTCNTEMLQLSRDGRKGKSTVFLPSLVLVWMGFARGENLELGVVLLCAFLCQWLAGNFAKVSVYMTQLGGIIGGFMVCKCIFKLVYETKYSLWKLQPYQGIGLSILSMQCAIIMDGTWKWTK